VIKFLQSVFAATPSVALGYVGAWHNLFKNTAILRPDIPIAIANTAIGLSVFLSMVFVLVGRAWAPDYMKGNAKKLALVSVILAVVCYGIHTFLSWPRGHRIQSVLTPTWDFFGCVFVVTAILAVTFGSLYAVSTDTNTGPNPYS
jgi:hypothetical protein